MKKSCSHIAWSADCENEAIEVLCELGFHGIEIAPAKLFGGWDKINNEEIAKAKALYKNAGLEISAMQGILFNVPDCHLFGSVREQQNLFEHLVFLSELGHELGARAMVFGAPKNRQKGELATEAAFDKAVEFFSRLADKIEGSSCKISFEANPSVYQCDFINETIDAIKLVKAVDRNAFKMQLDTGTILTNNEDPIPLVSEAGLIQHFHVSEVMMGPVVSDNQKHQAISQIYSACHEDVWLSVEMKGAETWRQNIVSANDCLEKFYLNH